MNPMPGICPVCANALHVSRLQCAQCGTGIDGAFGLGRFQALTPEQLHFVETFIKSRGKIKDVESELGISYPTVVARLNEVVRAMGYEVDERDLSEVDRYEMYEAQVIQPRVPPTPGQPFHPGNPPTIPTLPLPPLPPKPPAPPTRLSPERRIQVLKDLDEGKISLDEAMRQLHGEH